jgi:hypothetical protein
VAEDLTCQIRDVGGPRAGQWEGHEIVRFGTSRRIVVVGDPMHWGRQDAEVVFLAARLVRHTPLLLFCVNASLALLV